MRWGTMRSRQGKGAEGITGNILDRGEMCVRREVAKRRGGEDTRKREGEEMKRQGSEKVRRRGSEAAKRQKFEEIRRQKKPVGAAAAKRMCGRTKNGENMCRGSGKKRKKLSSRYRKAENNGLIYNEFRYKRGEYASL